MTTLSAEKDLGLEEEAAHTHHEHKHHHHHHPDDAVVDEPAHSDLLREHDSKKSRCCYIPRRFIFVFLGFWGFFNVYALRVVLSVAIVNMQTQFDWDNTTKGIILSSFFYGYILTQIPSGFLSGKYGGKWFFGLGVLVTGIGTLVTAPLLQISPSASVHVMIAIRVIEGFAEGMTYPAMHALIAIWCPPKEMARMSAVLYSGSFLGNVVTFPVSGALCNIESWNWQSVHYLFGGLAIIWFIFWFIFAYDSPEKHPTISHEEREYIVSSHTDGHSHAIKPALKFLINIPFLVLCLNHFCQNWGFFTLLTWLPQFFVNVFGFNVAETGLLEVLPYSGMFIVWNLSGFLNDFLLVRDDRYGFSRTVVRKGFQCSAFFLAGFFLVLVGYVPNATLGIALMTLSVSFDGLTAAGFQINHIDISPTYAGVLMGVTNTVATIPGIVSPTLTGYLLGPGDKGSIENWRTIFFISAGFYLLGIVSFAIFGSGEKQKVDSSMH